MSKGNSVTSASAIVLLVPQLWTSQRPHSTCVCPQGCGACLHSPCFLHSASAFQMQGEEVDWCLCRDAEGTGYSCGRFNFFLLSGKKKKLKKAYPAAKGLVEYMGGEGSMLQTFSVTIGQAILFLPFPNCISWCSFPCKDFLRQNVN